MPRPGFSMQGLKPSLQRALLGAAIALLLAGTAHAGLVSDLSEMRVPGGAPEDMRILDRIVFAFRDGLPDDPHAWAESLGGSLVIQDDRIHIVVVAFPGAPQAEAALADARRDDALRWVEYDHHAFVEEHDVVDVVNDPLYAQQWGLPAIEVPQAWEKTRGDRSVRVAILDTGVEGTHPDLVPNLCGPHASFVSDPNPLSDPNGHGTHVAGTVAAVIDNGIGVAGIADVCIMAVKVLGGGAGTGGIAAGITWAADNGAHIIGMSFYTTAHPALRDALDYAYLTKDVMNMKSAGNQGCVGAVPAAYLTPHSMTPPGPYDSVIAVAALAPPNGQATAGFSSCGNKMELAAPGQSILSTYRGGAYATLSGTSMAQPHASGVAALVRSIAPGLSALEVRCILALTANDVNQPGWDPFTGWGRVNARAAVALAQEWAVGLEQATAPTTCALPPTYPV